MATLISILVGLVGVLVGGFLTWIMTSRQKKLSTTFDMHREFNSPEMIKARYGASELLDRENDDDFAQLRLRLGRDAMQDLWSVMYFYQRLWLGIKYRGVLHSYVVDLFGDMFWWWYHRTFKNQLVPLPIEPAAYIQDLYLWMLKHSTEAKRRRWEEGNRIWARRMISSPTGSSTTQPSNLPAVELQPEGPAAT